MYQAGELVCAGYPLTWWRGEACRVHSRIEVSWRDGRRFALAQLLDRVQHFLLSQDALAGLC